MLIAGAGRVQPSSGDNGQLVLPWISGNQGGWEPLPDPRTSVRIERDRKQA